MKNKKVLIVFGTRPEAIKMAPLVKYFEKKRDIEFKVCVTAQHREMLDQVLAVFDLRPDFDLDIMKPGQDLFDVTTNVLMGMKGVLNSYQPDLVLVHGDTATAMATALAAFYLHIPVGHVEAGLRTYNLESPWPEEANRQIIDTIASYFYAPTTDNRQTLIKEGVSPDKIFVTGNTVIDALKWVVNENDKNEGSLTKIVESKGYKVIDGKKIILVTGHRRENFGDGFIQICMALKEIANKFPDADIVYPVHMNPNVKNVIYKELSDVKNIYLIAPLDYQPFSFLMKKAYIILTDSGGIQEEAPSLGKPVLVMRDTTERPEAVAAGTVMLVGTSVENIVSKVSMLMTNEILYSSFSKKSNPYGDGTACESIYEMIAQL